MLLWLLIIVLVVFIVGAVLFERIDWFGLCVTCGSIAACAGIGLIIAICIMISNHVGIDGKIAGFHEYKQMIETKIESGVYADEFGILDKNVVNEINNYNTQVRYKQAYSHDFWVGIFYPNVYDDLELIKYDIVPIRE